MEISHKFILPTVQYPYMGAKNVLHGAHWNLGPVGEIRREREREATHHHSSHPAKQAVGRLTSSHLAAAARSPTNVAFNGAHSSPPWYEQLYEREL